MNNMTLTSTVNTTLSQTTSRPIGDDDDDGSHVLAYILIPIGSLAIVAIISFVVMMIFRKNRLDRLRHHLMPLYNFDPQEEDWESELLDDRRRKINYRDGSPSPTSPKLKFVT